jgi:hypothetical protein
MTDLDGLFPDMLVAVCSREQAEQIILYDHHVVVANGDLPGVMITYHWMPLEEAEDPLILMLIPAHVDVHPPAPPEIQAIIDQLMFTSLE